jgi:hypothetical protein
MPTPPSPALAPYWPSFPNTKGDPFTLWFLTGNDNMGGAVITDFADAHLEAGFPLGTLTWPGPYNKFTGAFLPGLVPSYPTPMTYYAQYRVANPSVNAAFNLFAGSGGIYGGEFSDALGIPDSPRGFGNGLVNPAGGTFSRSPMRHVVDVGLVVQTDAYGKTGIRVNCSGQWSKLSRTDTAPAIGSSPLAIPGAPSILLKFGSSELWTLPISAGDCVIDAITGISNFDANQTITTRTFTDIVFPADIPHGQLFPWIGGQTFVDVSVITLLQSWSCVSWTGHAMIPVPSGTRLTPTIAPWHAQNTPLAGFSSPANSILRSSVFHALHPSGHDLAQAPIQGFGGIGFGEFTVPGVAEDYFVSIHELLNGPDPGVPADSTPHKTPQYSPVGSPIISPSGHGFPNFFQADPPPYLWYLDRF